MESIIPTIGSSGYFVLRSPFDSLILTGERYTCKAVRKMADFITNNEKPLDDIYIANGLTEVQYQEDLKNDVVIVSLQAATGHWVYVPATYINTLPLVNGIPYRTLMLGVSLPALPADRDLSHLEVSVKNLVTDSLGVLALTKFVETSKVVLIDSDKHRLTEATRAAVSDGGVTDRARLGKALLDNQRLLQQIQILQDYIKDKDI